MQVRGRYLVVAWTAVFLAAVGTIVFRARAGFQAQGRVNKLESEIKALESSWADMSATVARLEGRPTLAPKAEALGLKHPPDSDQVILRVPVNR